MAGGEGGEESAGTRGKREFKFYGGPVYLVTLGPIPGGAAGSKLVPCLPTPEPGRRWVLGDGCGTSEHVKGWLVGPLPPPGA